MNKRVTLKQCSQTAFRALSFSKFNKRICAFQKNIQYHINVLYKENKKDMSKSITKMLWIRKRQWKFVKWTSTVRRTAHEEPIMYRKECSEETLIIKIGPVSSFFWNSWILFSCGILDAAQPDPASSGPQFSWVWDLCIKASVITHENSAC